MSVSSPIITAEGKQGARLLWYTTSEKHALEALQGGGGWHRPYPRI